MRLSHFTMKEHLFTTYVRTKTLFKQRLKHLNDYDSVRIYEYELKKLRIDGPLLYSLRDKGEISYTEKGDFRALRPGPIDIDLLNITKKRERIPAPLTSLHIWMRDILMDVTLESSSNIPVYFQAFLDFRKTHLDSFFTVDSFCGRVHTPIVNLKASFRPALRLNGEPVMSLDVKQMQPTILGKILFDCIGSNPFSDAINNGKDIYVLLQEGAALPDRSAAKKLFFQLIFGRPMNDIKYLFKGDIAWVEWINSYKSRRDFHNPHGDSPHTNLAWLLQYSEVQVMTSVWQALKNRSIPFLSIHDELLCRKSDVSSVSSLMSGELRRHFQHFEVIIS